VCKACWHARVWMMMGVGGWACAASGMHTCGCAIASQDLAASHGRSIMARCCLLVMSVPIPTCHADVALHALPRRASAQCEVSARW
jgi:hypothetical protein